MKPLFLVPVTSLVLAACVYEQPGRPSAGVLYPTRPAASSSQPGAPAAPIKVGTLESFSQEVPGTGYKLELIPVPGDAAKKIAPFFVSKTEITWDAFDAYAYRYDVKPGETETSDAYTRPTKPYLPPDRGFGHEGYPAISQSYRNAVEYCKWLSAKTGKKFRLASEDEWEHACLAGSKGPFSFENPAEIGSFAWYDENASGSPHAVATKKPNAWGLYDMHGNVAEWVEGRDGKPVVKGGSYLDDDVANLAATARQKQQAAWSASDPQIPKSPWWLPDGPHIGFRVVCEADPATGKPAAAPKPDANKPTADKPDAAKPPAGK